MFPSSLEEIKESLRLSNRPGNEADFRQLAVAILPSGKLSENNSLVYTDSYVCLQSCYLLVRQT